MRSADEVQVVTVEKLADHIGPKREGDSPVILPPALDIFVWVWPQQIAQQAWQNKNKKMFLFILYSRSCDGLRLQTKKKYLKHVLITRSIGCGLENGLILFLPKLTALFLF